MNAAKRMIPLVIAWIVLLILFRMKVPAFLARDNMIDLVQQISVNAIIACGMTYCILIGGIDLSVGAVLALVGTVTVWAIEANTITERYLMQSTVGFLASVGLPGSFAAPTLAFLKLLLAVGAGMGVAALFGLFNGFFASRTKMPPFIITLASMLVARGVALRINETPIRVPAQDTLFLAIGNARIGGVVPVPVIIMLVLLALGAVLLHRTRFGQHLYAIGGNREAARFTGINVGRAELIVYILCAVLTGVAGMIHASQLYSAEPNSGQGFELNAIAAAVVGGTSFTGGVGTIPGMLLGAVIIGTLDKGLNQAGVHFSLQYILKGLVILAAVYMDVRRKRQG